MVKKKVPVKKHFRKITTSNGRKVVKVEKHLRKPSRVVKRKQHLKKDKKKEEGLPSELQGLNKTLTEEEIFERFKNSFTEEEIEELSGLPSLIRSRDEKSARANAPELPSSDDFDRYFTEEKDAQGSELGDLSPEFIEAMVDGDVFIPSSRQNAVQEDFNKFKSRGYGDVAAVRMAADKEKERQSPEYQRQLLAQHIATKENIADRAELKAKTKARSQDRWVRMLDAKDAEKFLDSQGRLKKKYASEGPEYDKFTKQVENRLKYLGEVMTPPKNEEEREEFVEELLSPVNEFEVSRADIATDLIKNPDLRNKLAKGTIPRDVQKELKELGIYTDSQGKIRRGLVKNLASQAEKHAGQLEKGVVPDSLKVHFKKMNINLPDDEVIQSYLASNPGAKAEDVYRTVLTDVNQGKSVKERLKEARSLVEQHPDPGVSSEALKKLNVLEKRFGIIEGFKQNKEAADNLREQILEKSRGSDPAGKWTMARVWLNSLPKEVRESPRLVQEYDLWQQAEKASRRKDGRQSEKFTYTPPKTRGDELGLKRAQTKADLKMKASKERLDIETEKERKLRERLKEIDAELKRRTKGDL